MAYYVGLGYLYNLVAGAIEAALFSAFSANYGVEGATVTQTNFDDAFGMGTLLDGRSSTSDAPWAYINYLFFDKEMNYVSAGFKQITSAANGSHEHIAMDEFVADREGYVFVYLSNETAGPEVIVSFDDLKVYHGKTNVVATSDYYPFGGGFNEYNRNASITQNFLYNGKEFQEETGWLDYGARMYDANLGRFFTHDRFSEKYYEHAPYHYVMNNPS